MVRLPIAGASRPLLADAAAVHALVAPELATRPHETLRALHLDAGRRLIGSTDAPGGTSGHVTLPLRVVIQDALGWGTIHLILVHNHPGGDPRPSAADRAETRRVAQVARALDILLDDHVIVAGEQWCSLRAMGLL